jgi:hypothetical protein
VAASDTLLLGTISLDHYLSSGDVLPGGGVLNMAWHWRRLGREFQVLARIGVEDAARGVRREIRPGRRARLARRHTAGHRLPDRAPLKQGLSVRMLRSRGDQGTNGDPNGGAARSERRRFRCRSSRNGTSGPVTHVRRV